MPSPRPSCSWSLRPGAPTAVPADLALATLAAVVLAAAASGGKAAGAPVALALALAGRIHPRAVRRRVRVHYLLGFSLLPRVN